MNDLTVEAKMKAIFAASDGSYGSRRIRSKLCVEGIHLGRYKILRLMRQYGLRPVWKRKFIHTTDSKHDLPVADNLLNRQFDVAAPNRAWVSDITYIRTRSGWLYLAVVMDLFSRRIVGWAMASHMRTSLVSRALSRGSAGIRTESGGFHSKLLFELIKVLTWRDCEPHF